MYHNRFVPTFQRSIAPTLTTLLLLTLLAGCVPVAPPAEPAAEAPAEEAVEAPADDMVAEADLAAVKSYALGNAANMKDSSAELLEIAQRYYDIVAENDFDYAAALDANAEEISSLIEGARDAWLTTSEAYELDEGIVAGVPSLAYYDVLIDAGPSAEEAPDEALEWTLTLPDGTELESPGNYFHSLLEPLLWQTNPEFVADVDGQSLPEANLFLGTAQGLDEATQELNDALDEWDPTLSDAFTALVVMVPTMNEYFEQWKLSAFVTGEDAEQMSFVATSRLFDITNILEGLDVTYENVAPLVEAADPDQHAQIVAGFDDLITYVDDLYTQEQEGVQFSAEEADLFGTEAQDRATALAGQISQAAALLDIEIQE